MTCEACQYNNAINTISTESFEFLNKDNIHIMWYPSTFSQSRLGNENSGI